jgi:AbiV family abortive infection protein
VATNRLDQFASRLSAEQAAAGMNAAEANASRLLDDATLLLEAGRFPSAACLAILSIEEAGKVSILREIVLARSDEEAKGAWRAYRSHTKKNVTWTLPELVAQGARTLEELRPLMDPKAEHPYLLDHLKQLGFYTDCLGKAAWSTPDGVIDESLARTLVSIARVLAGRQQHTVREVELWVQHLGPVWKGELRWMKTGLQNWYQAMRTEGLSAQDGETTDSFIWGPTPSENQT